MIDKRVNVAKRLKDYKELLEAFKEGKEELKSIFDFNSFTIRTGFVKFGYYVMDGEKFNCWNIDFMQKDQKINKL